MAEANSFKLEVRSRPDNVGLVRLAVAALAAAAPFAVADLEEIKVAVSEAVTNALVHGYGGRDEGWVLVEASLSAEWLRVVVADRGCGMEDVGLARQAAADGERLGLGVLFMETFMDEVAIESHPGVGTRVVLQKRVPAPSAAALGREAASDGP